MEERGLKAHSKSSDFGSAPYDLVLFSGLPRSLIKISPPVSLPVLPTVEALNSVISKGVFC